MPNIHELKNGFHYAMHGNGLYAGNLQTNSYEAFMHWYEKGVRIFEIDFAITEDKRFVCIAHHVNRRACLWAEILKRPACYTADWFLTQKLFSGSTFGLTPLSLEAVIDLVKRYQDIVIVMDLYGMFERAVISNFTTQLGALIEDRADILDRILIETYNADMIAWIKSINPKMNMIYSVEYSDCRCEKIPAGMIKTLGVEFVSYAWRYAQKNMTDLESYVKEDRVVLSRTEDSSQLKKLQTAGIHVNLVDVFCEGQVSPYQKSRMKVAAMYSFVKRAIAKLLTLNETN